MLTMKKFVCCLLILWSAWTAAAATSDAVPKKVGVLLVSHGSRSDSWRKMLTDIEDAVRDDVLKDGRVARLRSAFMEYKEPSIATQMKAFDRDGCTEVVVVPLLLSVSSHSFDDIPTILGQKQDRRTSDTLRLEGIAIYRPKAHVTIAPLLDFPAVLEQNAVRRVRQMSRAPAEEGVVSDLFAVGLIVVAVTGLFVMRGRRGITRRGAALAAVGLLIPLAFLLAVP